MKFFLSRAERLEYLGFDDRWSVVLGVPILAGVAFMLFTGANRTISPVAILTCYLLSLAHVVVYWGSLRATMVALRRRYPDGGDSLRRIFYFLPLGAVIILTLSRLSQLLVPYYLPVAVAAGWHIKSLVFEFIVSFTLSSMVVAIYESIYFFAKFRQSSLERERLARENMQSQLAVLRQQINPHFLFNSLNTLVNIIPEDDAKAVLFTQRLSAVYRRVLEYRHRELIGLEEELGALRDYLFLLQTRFEDKLRVELPGPTAGTRVQGGYRIVPLTLQLLVENAIKHNVVSAEDPLTVSVTLADDRIIVANSLRLRSRRIQSTGWGHHNIRQRYRMVTERPVEIGTHGPVYSVSVPLIPAHTPSVRATA